MSDLHTAIEKAIKDHCEGGDLWLCAHIASKPFDAQLEQLRAELSAAVADNAALLAANRDLKAHFDALKGDYDEAAHFARHFIRDDAAITPRGAIIRLGDKCTDLFVRLQQAEARLAAIDGAPTVAHRWELIGNVHTCFPLIDRPIGTELIARPAKD